MVWVKFGRMSRVWCKPKWIRYLLESTIRKWNIYCIEYLSTLYYIIFLDLVSSSGLYGGITKDRVWLVNFINNFRHYTNIILHEYVIILPILSKHWKKSTFPRFYRIFPFHFTVSRLVKLHLCKSTTKRVLKYFSLGLSAVRWESSLWRLTKIVRLWPPKPSSGTFSVRQSVTDESCTLRLPSHAWVSCGRHLRAPDNRDSRLLRNDTDDGTTGSSAPHPRWCEVWTASLTDRRGRGEGGFFGMYLFSFGCVLLAKETSFYPCYRPTWNPLLNPPRKALCVLPIVVNFFLFLKPAHTTEWGY